MTDEQGQWFKRLVDAGVPKVEARMLATNNIRDTEALTYAKEFVQSNDRERDSAPSMLILAGPTGVGKTIAACYLIKHRLTDPATGKPRGGLHRFRHTSVLAEIGMSWEDSDKKARQEWRDAGCLVVDDVGAELKTDSFLAMFDALVNHRYGDVGITCFTTNLPAEEFGRRYGERILDRIRGRGAWYDINHQSLRGGAS